MWTRDGGQAEVDTGGLSRRGSSRAAGATGGEPSPSALEAGDFRHPRQEGSELSGPGEGRASTLGRWGSDLSHRMILK